MSPRVSICVPNLNTRPFLPDRFRTIFDQSFTDWELLVYDSHSTDGAWEYFTELAAREPRMRIWQGPKEGTPGSWSPCVREARGEYVYIATSDDTMPPDCLAKLVAALDAHPDCDLAHCRLRAIDEEGREVAERQAWWERASLFARSSGPLLDVAHVRRAPFDGLLHLLGESVYISITQLLIRRSLFDRVGLFQSTWGSVGDFNWSMRAGLVANTVHVPDTWGGWRIHTAQATAGARLGTPEHRERIAAMIENALESAGRSLTPALRRRVAELRAQEDFDEIVARSSRPVERRSYILAQLFTGSKPARQYLKSWIRQRDAAPADAFPDRLRACLERAGHGPVVSRAS